MLITYNFLKENGVCEKGLLDVANNNKSFEKDHNTLIRDNINEYPEYMGYLFGMILEDDFERLKFTIDIIMLYRENISDKKILSIMHIIDGMIGKKSFHEDKAILDFVNDTKNRKNKLYRILYNICYYIKIAISGDTKKGPLLIAGTVELISDWQLQINGKKRYDTRYFIANKLWAMLNKYLSNK